MCKRENDCTANKHENQKKNLNFYKASWSQESPITLKFKKLRIQIMKKRLDYDTQVPFSKFKHFLTLLLVREFCKLAARVRARDKFCAAASTSKNFQI